MARSMSLPEQDWSVGVYEAAVNGFTRNNTDALRITLTQPVGNSGWPSSPAVLGSMRVEWEDGSYAECPIPAQPRQFGEPINYVSLTVNVPRSGSGKKNVQSGLGRLTVTTAFRAAIAVAAI